MGCRNSSLRQDTRGRHRDSNAVCRAREGDEKKRSDVLQPSSSRRKYVCTMCGVSTLGVISAPPYLGVISARRLPGRALGLHGVRTRGARRGRSAGWVWLRGLWHLGLGSLMWVPSGTPRLVLQPACSLCAGAAITKAEMRAESAPDLATRRPVCVGELGAVLQGTRGLVNNQGMELEELLQLEPPKCKLSC